MRISVLRAIREQVMKEDFVFGLELGLRQCFLISFSHATISHLKNCYRTHNKNLTCMKLNTRQQINKGMRSKYYLIAHV
jgi:hypothetical protein